MARQRIAHPWPALLVAALALLAASAMSCASLARWRLQPELDRANRAFAQREYALAAVRYESLSDRYPDWGERAAMQFRQAIALYMTADYHDAEDALRSYLTRWPEGPNASDAQIYLEKIAVELSPSSPARKEALEQAKTDLNKLQALRVQHPSDPEVCYALANVYYEMGDYNEAARYYFAAQSIDAVYKEKTLLTQRLAIGPDGAPHALTPDDVTRLEREDNPLAVFGTHTYQSRAANQVISGGDRFYNVSGFIRNQGSRLLQGVEIEVRFLTAAHAIQDVQTVHIGTLLPGEVRSFRAEASSFDNLYNIAGFETVPRVGR